MAIIQTPLPLILVNGSLMNADEVMELFYYVVEQTNANAQPMGSSFSEWILAEGVPAFVGLTQFTISGDQSANMLQGRALKMVISAGALVFGYVASATYDGSSNITTVNIAFNDANLDVGLSTVYYGILQANPRSTPAETVMTATLITADQVLVAPSQATVIFNGQNVPPGGTIDTLGEYDVATGLWTCRYHGHYRLEAYIEFVVAAAPQTFQMFIRLGGVNVARSALFVPDTSLYSCRVAVNTYCVAGEVYRVTVTCNLTNVTVFATSDITSRFMVTRLNGA